ncbi:MAG: hypothetical protein AAGD23_11155 [Pseudomonadota bacterium]
MIRYGLIIFLTGGALLAAWAAWTYAPMLVHRTPWQDYRHIFQLCAVFAVLCAAHALIKRLPGDLN